MAWVYYGLMLLLSAGALGLVVVTMPGLWCMAAIAAGYAAITHFRFVGVKTLIAMLVLAALAELADFLAAGRSARAAGAGWPGILGGTIGGLLGGIFLTLVPIPVISTLVGICVGSFAGAAVSEWIAGSNAGGAARIGIAAAKGKLMGIAVKLAVGVVMLAMLVVAGIP